MWTKIPYFAFKCKRNLSNAVYRPLTDIPRDLGDASMGPSLAVALQTLCDLLDVFSRENNLILLNFVSNSSSWSRCGGPATALASRCARLSWYDVHVVGCVCVSESVCVDAEYLNDCFVHVLFFFFLSRLFVFDPSLFVLVTGDPGSRLVLTSPPRITLVLKHATSRMSILCL